MIENEPNLKHTVILPDESSLERMFKWQDNALYKCVQRTASAVKSMPVLPKLSELLSSALPPFVSQSKNCPYQLMFKTPMFASLSFSPHPSPLSINK